MRRIKELILKSILSLICKINIFVKNFKIVEGLELFREFWFVGVCGLLVELDRYCDIL